MLRCPHGRFSRIYSLARRRRTSYRIYIGGAVGKVVASLVNDIVLPLLSLILGSTEGLKGLAYLGIQYGAFLTTLLDFVIIAAVIYFVFKRLGIEKLDKPKP